MTISGESFTTLLKHDREIIEKYLILKNRVNELIRSIGKTKVIKHDVKEEMAAHIKLVEISFREIDEGNKEFEKWVVSYLDALPKISEENKSKLDEITRKMGTRNYNETIQELLIIFENEHAQG